MRLPSALLALPVLAGSAAGLLTCERQSDLFPLLTASAAMLVWLAAAASCGDGCAPECSIACVVAAALAGLSLGATAAKEAYEPPLLRWFDSLAGPAQSEPIIVEGVLAEDAAVTPAGVSLVIRAHRVRQGDRALECARGCGGIRVSVAGAMAAGRASAWRAGRRIRCAALLRHPSVFHNPGVPDERKALARRGVALAGSVKSAALVDVVNESGWLDTLAAQARAWARRRIADSVGPWSARSAAVATAILIGDRSGLSLEDEQRLQRAGTYHVIAISGGNIAILAALLLGTFALLPVSSRLAAASTILALLFYGRMAGSAASVDRAVLVAVLYLAARLIDRPGPALNALAVACVLGVAFSPVIALDPGFILSFGATLAIVVGVRRILPARTRVRSRLGRIARSVALLGAGLLAATVCADVALTPIAALIFSRVTFAGLLLNFIAIPLMAAVQSGALTVLALADVAPSAALHCGYLVHLAADGLIESSRLVDAMPWLARDVLRPAWWLLAIYYSAVTLALTSKLLRRCAAVTALLSGSAIVAGLPPTAADAVPPVPPATLRIVILDVGQGDATLVALPGGRTLLVDAGGLPGTAFDIGDRVVLPALRVFRVRRLDTFVITHGDPDHVGGAAAVLAAARPRSIWEGVPVPRHEGLRLLGEAASRIGASWRYVQAGDVERAGGVEISVLHPPPPDWERQRVRNEDSVVLEFRIGDVAVVLPGDIGREAEHAMLARLSPAPTVILKAPHHGSATSSSPELLQVLNPAAVIFSAGRNNRFGHPHPAVVERYRMRGTHIFSTQHDGAVVVETDGTKVEIRGWTGRFLRLASREK